jgi:hypothetical protein
MIYKPAMSRPCNPEQYFIGKGFTGCSNEVFDVLRVWCSMLENNQSVESLFKMELPDEFLELINKLRTKSFNRQIEYLEKVFFIIDKNDDMIIQNYLKKNELTSLEWCKKFKVPISYQRFLIGDLQTCQPVFSQ